MNIKIIKTLGEYLEIEEDYVDLWEHSVERLVFNSPVFLRSYIKNFEGIHDLNIVCLYDEHKMLGLAPVYMVSKKKGFLKWKELRFASEGDSRGLIVRKKVNSNDISHNKIVKALLNSIEDFDYDRICLDHIDSGSLLFSYMSKSTVYNPGLKLHIVLPYHDMDRYSTFEEYFSDFPSKTKKYMKHLLRDHPYVFEVHTSFDLDLYQETSNLHIYEKNYLNDRYKKNRHSLYENTNMNEYVKYIQSESDMILNFTMRRQSDGKLICYRDTYLNDRTIYSWNAGYDPEFENYSINNIFFYEIFKYLYEQDLCDRYSFGSGGYTWKFTLTDKFAVNYKYDVFRPKAKKIEKIIKFKNALKNL